MNSRAQNLSIFGWGEYFEAHFQPYAAGGFGAARVALEHKDTYRVYIEEGEMPGEITGKLRHHAANREDLPAAGDWVVIRPRHEGNMAMIHAVLPRRSVFTRKAAGPRTVEQIVGANIDTVFLVTSLNGDFNPRRIERYLTIAWEGGASPVIVLSKADLCGDVEERVATIQGAAAGVPVHAVSVIGRSGLEELAPYFGRGQTVALLGSSGVGKSTLINHLVGREQQRVQEARGRDDRGRHTTTCRELILLPRGGLVLDTPGMRELQLWEGEGGIRHAFEEIEALAGRCHFSDCRHRDEPRCAIREALAEGEIDAARYGNYEKLRKELEYVARKQDVNARINEKRKWKKLTRLAGERARTKRG